jgi:hypothetical protein
VAASVDASEDRIDDACGTVDDVKRRRESGLGLARRMCNRVLVRDPACIDGILVDAVARSRTSLRAASP